MGWESEWKVNMKSLSATRLGRVHETGDARRATTGVSQGAMSGSR